MKLFEGDYDQMVLERLDRLTLGEGWITASQILKVVHDLIQNMRAASCKVRRDADIETLFNFSSSMV